MDRDTESSDANRENRWMSVYLLSAPVGAVVLPAWLLYLIQKDGDPGGPMGFLFVMIFAVFIGAAGGLLAVALIHFVVWANWAIWWAWHQRKR